MAKTKKQLKIPGTDIAGTVDEACGKQSVIHPAEAVLLARRAAAAGGAFHEAQALLQPVQQALRAAVPWRQIEHGDWFAGACGLRQHRGAVAGDDEFVGECE